MASLNGAASNNTRRPYRKKKAKAASPKTIDDAIQKILDGVNEGANVRRAVEKTAGDLGYAPSTVFRWWSERSASTAPKAESVPRDLAGEVARLKRENLALKQAIAALCAA